MTSEACADELHAELAIAVDIELAGRGILRSAGELLQREPSVIVDRRR